MSTHTSPTADLTRIELDLARTTRNLDSMIRRVRSGQLTGRNGDASERGMEHHWQTGKSLIAYLCTLPDDVWDEDRHGKLVERFWSVERRYLGLA